MALFAPFRLQTPTLNMTWGGAGEERDGVVRNESGGKHQSVKVERNLWRSANGEEGREGGRDNRTNYIRM